MSYEQLYPDTTGERLLSQGINLYNPDLIRANSISRLVYAWIMKHTQSWDRLLQDCYILFDLCGDSSECYSVLKEFVLALPEEYQLRLRHRISETVQKMRPSSAETASPDHVRLAPKSMSILLTFTDPTMVGRRGHISAYRLSSHYRTGESPYGQ